MRVGGQDPVALVERHVQGVLRPWCPGCERQDEQWQRGPPRPFEQAASGRMQRGDERERSGDDDTHREQRPLPGERPGDEVRECCGRDLLQAGDAPGGVVELCEQPDRDHEAGERPVADVAHLRPLVQDPRAEQVDRSEADRERQEREAGHERGERAGRPGALDRIGEAHLPPAGPQDGEVPPATSSRGLPSPRHPDAISPTWTV